MVNMIEVIQYVNEKYGKDQVAQILTVGPLTTKAVARDVGGVLNYEEAELKPMSSLIDKSKATNIKDVYKKSKEFQEFVNLDNRNQIWFDTCADEVQTLNLEVLLVLSILN